MCGDLRFTNLPSRASRFARRYSLAERESRTCFAVESSCYESVISTAFRRPPSALPRPATDTAGMLTLQSPHETLEAMKSVNFVAHPPPDQSPVDSSRWIVSPDPRRSLSDAYRHTQVDLVIAPECSVYVAG